MAVWTIWANYDPEARVWYTVQGELPGLSVDADTIEDLARKAGEQLPDLLEIHADQFSDRTDVAPPHRIRVIAFHEREFPVAA
jgi:hypothetical protein